MPRKNAAARKRACYACPGKSSASNLDEDDQLAQAILASKVSSMQNDTYKNALARALDVSEVDAKREAEEAEMFRLAVAASLVDAEQKGLGLGLNMAASHQAQHSKNNENASFPGSSPDLSPPCGSSALHMPSIKSIAPCSPGRAGVRNSSTDATLRRILKVTYNQDTRRLYTQWSSGAQARDILTRIQKTIEESFGLPPDSAEPPSYSLKYLDDEGDLCTLVEHTLVDFLGTSVQGSSLKIVLQKDWEQKLHRMDLQGFDGCSCNVQDMPDIEGTAWDHAGLPDIQNIDNVELSALADFSIATPPSTPRADSPTSCSRSIEDDYDSVWAFVELEN